MSANPSLRDQTAMGVFDAVVAGLTEAGLMVLLNNHNSGAGWCCRWGSTYRGVNAYLA